MLEYRKATKKDVEQIFDLIQNTIRTVYPQYYPKEIVDFFCQLHSRNNIMADIEKENLKVLFSDGRLAGTGSCAGNHITRVYVAFNLQGKGYGSYLMQQLENEIAEKYDSACLDASLPASCFYEHRGYKTIKHEKMQVENGVYLVYEIMEKRMTAILTDYMAECRIREWKQEDGARLAAMLNNKNILDNLRDGLPYPYTISDAKDYITAMLSADKTKTFAFAIEANNEVIGSIGVFRCDNIHFRTAEMGYYIGEPYWGKGYATSAVRQTCQYIFEHTDIIRIFAEPFAYNTASCRVLEKAGFQLEGTLYSNAVKNGTVLDMKMYALIKK